MEEITASQEVDIVDDQDKKWIEDWSKSELEFDDEQQQSFEQEMINLRVLEWLNEMTSEPKETSVTSQDVDRESLNYIKNDKMTLPVSPGRAIVHYCVQSQPNIRYAIDGDVYG